MVLNKDKGDAVVKNPTKKNNEISKMKKFIKRFFLFLMSLIAITTITVYTVELVHELLTCLNNVYQLVVNQMVIGFNDVNQVVATVNLA
jgi:lipopolysaccharide/colanic/teichoic acid biosynthesis glycosyltransferase